MRIAHISDIHIRNLKFHSDYQKVFNKLYEKLRELNPDLIVNTGDTAHTKTQISPEFVEMASTHFQELARIAPLHIILGNHDLNLMNADRQDAITPIIQSINSQKIRLHKKSGLVDLGIFAEYDCEQCAAGEHPDGHMWDNPRLNFWVFGIGDQENYPKPEDWAKHTKDVNIGLFHGSVLNCVTDSNWRMTHTEQELSLFEGLDYVLMGDIHKQQFMDARKTIGYAGSLIQQNFGEDVDKGFLVWDIESKTKHKVWPVYLKGARPFVTVDLGSNKILPNVNVEPNARVRLRPQAPMTLLEQKAIEKQAKKKYNTADVITLAVTNVSATRSSIGKDSVAHENLRNLEVQERLIRRFLHEKKLSEKVLGKIMDLNRKYQVELDQQDDSVRNISWQLNKIAWNNLFNYGEGNYIDFSALNGLTGIFAPNASGKSNLIDVMMQTLFDSTTKGIAKNIYIINDNKDQASAVAEISAEGKDYMLERVIERMKYGQRSGPTKEWGKTAVNFYGVLGDGVKETLNGVSRPETEKTIRRHVGTFDDAMLTSLFAQWNPMDVIQCKETERKRILYRFLDLDIFQQKHDLAKKDAREQFDRLCELEDSQVEFIIWEMKQKIKDLEEEVGETQENIEEHKKKLTFYEEGILKATSKKVKVDCDVDGPTEAGKIKTAELHLVRLGKELDGREELLATSEDELAELSGSLLLNEHVTELEKKVGRIKDLDSKITTLQTGRTSLVKDSEMAKKNLTLLEEVPCGDQYPQCKFLVNAFEGKKQLPVIKEKLDKSLDLIGKYQDERESLLDAELELREHKDNAQKHALALSKVENNRLQLDNIKLKIKAQEDIRDSGRERIKEFEKSEALIEKNKELDRIIAKAKADKQGVRQSLDALQETLSKNHMDLGSERGILSKLEEQQKDLHELRELCSAYEHLMNAMGKDGIAFDILKQKLPLINDEINKILSSAADFSVYVEHDPDEDSIRIYIQYSEYKQRLIELGSGAEKFLSSIAIRNALMNISNLPKTNMFIIDEGFGKLDPKNIENINMMFDYLRTVFDHIIVISHSDVMKDMVDNMIEITTDEDGYAHVEVG